MSTISFGQTHTIEVTFTASYDTVYVQLDSIKILNETQGCDTILYWPDTVLVLEYQVNIPQHNTEKSGFQVFQNYPNPMQNETNITVFIPEEGNVLFWISDVQGSEIITMEKDLTGGYHNFKFTPSEKGVSFFTAQWREANSGIKIINMGTSNTECSLEYLGYNNSFTEQKAVSTIQGFPFNLGDSLLYIGYAKTLSEFAGSDVLDDIPQCKGTQIFNIEEGTPCPYAERIWYMSQYYHTVLIGGQCWLKENMNYQTANSWCYDDIPSNCAIYGRLYYWESALEVCPAGWQLPSDAQWCTLTTYIDPTVDCEYFFPWVGTDVGWRMKSTRGWIGNNNNGIDEFGFKALPGGLYYYPYDTISPTIGKRAWFWTSTEISPTQSYYWELYSLSSQIRHSHINMNNGFSVRCIKY